MAWRISTILAEARARFASLYPYFLPRNAKNARSGLSFGNDASDTDVMKCRLLYDSPFSPMSSLARPNMRTRSARSAGIRGGSGLSRSAR
jgi:hypothetical protein